MGCGAERRIRSLLYRLAHKLSIHGLSTIPRVRVRRSRCVVEEGVIGELDDVGFYLDQLRDEDVSDAR